MSGLINNKKKRLVAVTVNTVKGFYKASICYRTVLLHYNVQEFLFYIFQSLLYYFDNVIIFSVKLLNIR